MLKGQSKIHIPVGILFSLILLLIVIVPGVLASPPLQETEPTPPAGQDAVSDPDGNLSISDDVCLECHGQPGNTMELENGDIIDLYVPAEAE